MIKLSLLLALAAASGDSPVVPSARARDVANYAHDTYGEAAIRTLAELVAFDTFQRDGTPNAEHPSFRAMSARLEEIAAELGLEFEDHGAVVVISLGSAEQRLGIVTHGDVQPADPSKWAQSPFTLDTESEPGLLVARGAEDDKGPIACALHAMRSIKEQGVPLKRRIELIISYTEESDWAPFQEFLAKNPAPDLNIAIDAEYPAVIAEKGWCSLQVSLPIEASESEAPRLASFSGGFFLSQVPEDAQAVVEAPTPAVEAALRAAARTTNDVTFAFESEAGRLRVRAHGLAAHSSKPEKGRNAITHLAELLSVVDWPRSAASDMVDFIHARVGTGYLAERFGDVAYAHPFMGPLTLSFSTLKEENGRLVGAINMRRPAGRSQAEVRATVQAAVESWKVARGAADVELVCYIGEPHMPEAPPHLPVLLATFQAYTGQTEAKAIAIGGGTHARLVPNGVNFGPAMPGVPYTGHSEHEFMSREQFLLNLRMYTSLLVDLAGE